MKVEKFGVCIFGFFAGNFEIRAWDFSLDWQKYLFQKPQNFLPQNLPKSPLPPTPNPIPFLLFSFRIKSKKSGIERIAAEDFLHLQLHTLHQTATPRATPRQSPQTTSGELWQESRGVLAEDDTEGRGWGAGQQPQHNQLPNLLRHLLRKAVSPELLRFLKAWLAHLEIHSSQTDYGSHS